MLCSQNHIDNECYVSNVDCTVLVSIGIQRIEIQSLSTQDIVYQGGHVSYADHAVTVHIARYDSRLGLYDVKTEGEVIDVEGHQIITTVAYKVVGIIVVAFGGGVLGACGDGRRGSGTKPPRPRPAS